MMSKAIPGQADHLVDQLNKASLFDLAVDAEPAGPRRAYELPSRDDLAPLFPDLEIQELLGSDIAMVLDHVIGLPAPVDQLREACERSVRWAERCRRAGRI